MVRRTIAKIAFAIAVTTNAQASVIGEGEYRFGPDMAENAACAIAEQRAKENAIANFVGEKYELNKSEYCKNENCITHSIAFSDVSGNIKRIIKQESQVAPERGYNVCVVNLVADVEEIKNPIEVTVVDPEHEFRHGDRFAMQLISNRVGRFYAFNFVNDEYTLTAVGNVTESNKQFRVPSLPYKFEVKVPIGKRISRELLVVLFTTQDLTVRQKYSRIEFEKLVKDIPFSGRKLVNHHLTILR